MKLTLSLLSSRFPTCPKNHDTTLNILRTKIAVNILSRLFFSANLVVYLIDLAFNIIINYGTKLLLELLEINSPRGHLKSINFQKFTKLSGKCMWWSSFLSKCAVWWIIFLEKMVHPAISLKNYCVSYVFLGMVWIFSKHLICGIPANIYNLQIPNL